MTRSMWRCVVGPRTGEEHQRTVPITGCDVLACSADDQLRRTRITVLMTGRDVLASHYGRRCPVLHTGVHVEHFDRRW